jgi:fermentation-respiration switch protein FrsA (DUF1100 family)
MLGLGEDDLSVYLNDHLAGATAGVDLARRVADGAIAAEIEEDRGALIEVMDRLAVRQDPAKVALGWAAVQASRLRFAAERLGHAPVTRLEQIEALALGVEGKLALWQALRQTHGADPRLDAIDFEDLIDRARSQRRRLERLRMAAADEALVSEAR